MTLDILQAFINCPTTHHTISLRVTESTPSEVMDLAVRAQAIGFTVNILNFVETY